MPLKTYRLAANLSQAELASRSGIAQPIISALELGKIARPSWAVVHALSTALAVDPELLFPPVAEPSEAAAS